MKELSDQAKILVEELFIGKENARKASELEWALIIPRSRTAAKVRELAREANLAGHPVVSGPDGFWLARTFEEIREYEQSLISRAMAILQRASALADVVPKGSQ
ncbi:MAG: hypothetical protein ACYSWU_00255 [Planctomycetota bacterium]